MDNSNAIALTLGLGTLGTILAYYGYNQLTDYDDIPRDKRGDSLAESGENVGVVEPSAKSKRVSFQPLAAQSAPSTKKQEENVEPAKEKGTTASDESSQTPNNVKLEIGNEIQKIITVSPPTDEEKWSEFWKKEWQLQKSNKQTGIAEFN